MKLNGWVLLGVIALAVGGPAIAPASARAAEGDLPAWYVDPALGQDDAAEGRGRSAALPFQSFPFALEAAALHVAAPEYSGPRGARFELAPAVIVVDPPAALLAAAPELEELVIEGPAGQEAAIRVFDGYTVRGLEVRPPAAAAVRVTFRRIAFVFGTTALVCYPPAAGTASLLVEDCRFLRQRADSILVPVAPGARASVTVRRTSFEDSLGGLSVLYGTGAEGDVTVEDCRFRRLRSYAGDGVLGAAVDIHLGERARASVRVARSSILGAGSAVQLTTAEENLDEAPSAGRLAAEIVNNVIEGSGPWDVELDDVLTHGIYLSLWPHHELAIGIRNNTFAYLGGHVLYHDNARYYFERGTAPSLTFANNIAWQIGGASELDLEALQHAEEQGSSWAPPAGLVIRSNLLEKSRLGHEQVDGNLTGDPLFDSPREGRYALLPGSPAVDRGDALLGTQDDRDFALGCRRSGNGCNPLAPHTQPIDVGAFELAQSHCHADLVPFVRGDCTSTSILDVTDAIFLFGYLFLGTEDPRCLDACDANDDAELNISDGVTILGYLFSGSPPPPAPFPVAGLDPTSDCHPSCR